jgi:hypothetical protein
MDIHPLQFAAIVIGWLVTYHLTYQLLSVARDPSLVFWTVGPFGIATVSLREPKAWRTVAQLLVAGAVLAILCYTTLYLPTPPPIAGLGQAPFDRLVVVALPVVALTLIQLFSILRQRRSPLWGEARVLAIAQRSAAVGARIFFTRAGRTFLHERFGATPREFLAMVR